MPSERALFLAEVLVMPLPFHLPSPTPPTGTLRPAMIKLRRVVWVDWGLAPPATTNLLSLRSRVAVPVSVSRGVLMTLLTPAAISARAAVEIESDDDCV